MASKTNLTGVAGEHYVLSELLRRGYIAALAPVGAPNADIVITNVECSVLCSIQVKTRRGVGTDGGWHLKEKNECIVGDLLFYCFVDFQDSHELRPLTYVVPSATVAEAIKKAHKKWLATPGKKGQQHKDNPVRRLLPDYSKVWAYDNPYPAGWLNRYGDAWHLLGLDATDPERSIAGE